MIAQLVVGGASPAALPQSPRPLTAVAMVVHISGSARYRVQLLGDRPQAVFTRTGWLVQERRITPISCTVDYRGPMDRLFAGLTSL